MKPLSSRHSLVTLSGCLSLGKACTGLNYSRTKRQVSCPAMCGASHGTDQSFWRKLGQPPSLQHSAVHDSSGARRKWTTQSQQEQWLHSVLALIFLKCQNLDRLWAGCVRITGKLVKVQIFYPIPALIPCSSGLRICILNKCLQILLMFSQEQETWLKQKPVFLLFSGMVAGVCLACQTRFDLGSTEAQDWEGEVHIQDPHMLLMVQPDGLSGPHFQLIKVSWS